MMKYNRMPLEFVGITQYFNNTIYPKHFGIDLGWNDNYGGQSAPIYAINDGKVIFKGYNDSAGNYIGIETVSNDTKFIHRYLHMRNPSPLNVNDTVTRGAIIGNMGNTGDSTGPHLHYELWKCPKNYTFNWADREKYAVNPLLYTYLFYNQVSNNKDIIRVLGTDLLRTKDKTKDQALVEDEYLRCRKDPNGEILGYIDFGLYDILETKDQDGYTWIKVDTNKWFAKTEKVTIYKKEQNNDQEDSDDQDSPIPADYKKFIAKADGIYYISLKKDDIVYYKDS